MRKTNNKGITLIALIVTIIVLIIIAGASIATLTSDNGILRQVNSAKVAQMEGNAREQVKLAVAAVRLAVAEAQAKDNSYSAKANSSLIQAKLIEVLNADKKDLTGSFSNGGTEAGDDQEEITIVYVGPDYTSATNNTSAKITYTIGLSQKTVALIDEENVTLKDQHGNDVNIDIGASTGDETGVNYLVDTVEIGDYVDIGVNYTNTEYYYNDVYGNSNTYINYRDTEGPLGWRVLSKTGSGASGTVTLVSAGSPISIGNYFGPGYVTESVVDSLLNMYEANMLSEYQRNNFESDDAEFVWGQTGKINTSTIHAMTTQEFVDLYAAITGSNKTIEELCNITNSINMNNLLSVNPNISTKAYDLLSIGMTYYLWNGELYSNGIKRYVVDDNYQTGKVEDALTAQARIRLVRLWDTSCFNDE